MSTLSGDVDSRLPLREAALDHRRLSEVPNAPDAALQISTNHGDIKLRALDAEAVSQTSPG